MYEQVIYIQVKSTVICMKKYYTYKYYDMYELVLCVQVMSTVICKNKYYMYYEYCDKYDHV